MSDDAPAVAPVEETPKEEPAAAAAVDPDDGPAPAEEGPKMMTLPDGSKMEALADGEYDVVIMGTGLKECILSGLLSTDKLRVLHMDRNSFYGGEAASLQLKDIFQKFRGDKAEPPASLGSGRDYNIDLMPKFIMASGKLVKMLIHTDVTKYLDFKSVEGSYVLKDNKINKVPSNDSEAVKSSLIGFFEKKRLRDFFIWVQNYDEANPKTHLLGGKADKNVNTITAAAFCSYFNLDKGSVDFLGHAMALYADDAYLAEPAIRFVSRVRLYAESLARYGQSPYIYPLYGLGELPQSFARLSAVYGGTYMLNTPVDEVLYNASGHACGVKSRGQFASCKFVVGDPSYFPDKVQKMRRVTRAICILSHPITPNNEMASQIIIPQSAVGRKNDIYVFCCSWQHMVAPEGKFIAFVSTYAETASPKDELKAGIALLGQVDEVFYDEYDEFAPSEDGNKDKVYLSKSYDPTSHFETTADDVLDMYRRITGKELDLTHQRVATEEM